MDDQVARERVARVEGLLEELEALQDPVAREKATEMVQALLDLYGEGLARALERVDEHGRQALAEDELVSHLLLLHDLHPVPLARRVQDALDGVRPYLESHGGDVELVAVEEGVARLRLQGSCEGCPSSTMTLKLAIEDAIQKLAPDVERIEAEGAAQAAPALLQIEIAGNGPSAAEQPPGEWATAGSLAELGAGDTVLKKVSGEQVLFMQIEGSFYAYRPECPACGRSLEGAVLRGADLRCPDCGLDYDARRAGRCLDRPEVHLEPVPLLVADSGLVKVALTAKAA